MRFNQLGKTNLKVSEVGLGTEFLFHQSKEIVKSVIHKAIESKINYFDILFSVTQYLDKLALIIKEYRDEIIITGHIGTVENAEGRPRKTRNLKECSQEFEKMLKILNIESFDIINIQYVRINEFEKIMQNGGLCDLATSLIDQGKARYLGLSTHDIPVIEKAILTGKFNMIMYPLNVINHGLEGRKEALMSIKKNNIGLIGIKPFAAGNILQQNKTINFAKYQTGGLRIKKKNLPDISAPKCLNYVTSIPEVSTVLMGVKSEQELLENLSFRDLSPSDKDWSKLVEYYSQ
jgi:predicted aldo/keto reductase-like oxidoreductase